jgi:hypothetical protein
MGEEWLDAEILCALERRARVNLDSDVEEIPVEREHRVAYDPRRLEIQLPGSDETASINYIPPNLTLGGDIGNPAASSEVHFAIPPKRFDLFEHFQYEWIEAPELEGSQCP